MALAEHGQKLPFGKLIYHKSAAVDLSFYSLNDIDGADVSPVFAGKITVSETHLNIVIYLFVFIFVFILQFDGTKLLHHEFSLFSGVFLLSRWRCLSMIAVSAA